MVLDVKLKVPDLEKLKVSRVVLISGLLTFLYLVEFCIGVRTVYYAFSLWSTDSNASHKTQKVSWTICVACLLVCVASSFSVNIISALWEQKQIKEDGKVKRATRFAFHIVVGGMIWRYVCMWFSDNKKSQKKESMMLAMAKFLFTQFFTIPMIIVHASLIESLEEVIYVVCSVCCISVNLLLICAVFSLCESEVKELKKWNYETLDLVPLIFSQTSTEEKVSKETSQEENSGTKKEITVGVSYECKEKTIETVLMRILVLVQTFGFTFGRLLALGILLKLAGIYAISIMFLQLLISVVYLKFQVPFLVSDSLPKWRQLTRLAFMSYILIFEWQLNRDPRTGYDFTSNIKHSLLYYSIATVESVFYFVAWAIAYSYNSDDAFNELTKPSYKLIKCIIIIGTMSLVFSLTVYFFLAFWQSRRLSSLMHSARRYYLSSKLKMTNSILKKGNDRKPDLSLKPSKLDISDPIPPDNEEQDYKLKKDNDFASEKHSSYKDLREPLDDEIEIFVGRRRSICKFKTVSDKESEDAEEKLTIKEEHNVTNCYISTSLFENYEEKLNTEKDPCGDNEQDISLNTEQELAKSESVVDMISDKDASDTKDDLRDVLKNDDTDPSDLKTIEASTSSVQPSDESQAKSKITALSESIGEGWNKFSALSKRFTGTMKEQFQKRKEQFQDLHGSSNKIDTGQVGERNLPNNIPSDSSPKGHDTDEISPQDSEEGFFVGDIRCCDDKNAFQSTTDMDYQDMEAEDKASQVSASSTVDIHSEARDWDSVHCVGDEPCPCFVCKPDGEGRLFRRRRSSSVPPADRKSWLESEMLSNAKTALSTPSSPTSVRVDMRSSGKCERKNEDDDSMVSVPPFRFPNIALSKISLLPPEERIEHYV